MGLKKQRSGGQFALSVSSSQLQTTRTLLPPTAKAARRFVVGFDPV